MTSSQRFENLEIPFKFGVHGEGAELYEPEGREMESSCKPVRLVSNWPIPKDTTEVVLKGKFQVQGTCDTDSEFIGFWYLQEFKGAFIMSREKAEKEYRKSKWKTEYTASVVIVPTDKLTVSIEFPEHYNKKEIRPDSVVFLGSTHVQNDSETKRIKEQFSMEGNKATLTVDNPVVGMPYAITWMPPSKVKARETENV